MKIDFTCPAELLSIEFTGESCSFYLNNLGEELITGAELKLSSFDEEQMLLDEQTIKYHDILSEPHEPLKLDFEVDETDFVYRELSIEKLWLEGGKSWRAGIANEFTYELNRLPDGRSLSTLQMVAGHDAVCYPEEQGDIWVCVCGRANRIDEELCRRCDRSKSSVFEKYNRDSVNEIASKIKAHNKQEDRQALQEAADMKDKQQIIAERVQKRKKHRINIAISAIVLFVAFFLIWYFGVPAYRSIAIDKHIEQGDFVWAKNELNKLPESYDIAPRMLVCDYNIAKLNMQGDSEEDIKKAIAQFDELNAYEDSSELLLEAKYRLGELYFDKKDYDKALDSFKAIESYSDSGLKITETNYNIALEKMDEGDMQGAKDILLTLESYSDTASLLMQIDYELGKKAFEDEKLEEALDLFSSSQGYSDAEEWYYKALYSLAGKEFEAKNFEGAGEYYLQIANNEKASVEFKDARTKANICLYEIGIQALANGEYERAANTLYGILDYVNSKQLYSEAIRAIALNHINNAEFDEALEELSSIDEDEGAIKLIRRAKYEKAKSLEASDIDGAIALYKDIQDYNDAGEIYLSLSYKRAEQMLADEKYDEAVLEFTQLGEYSDSQNRRKDALYAKAKALYNDNKLIESKDIFLSLEGYSDSSKLAKDIVMELANSYIADKSFEKAVAMLESIEQSEETEALLLEAKYLMATAFMNENNMEEALRYLEQIPDYRDSDSLLESVKYIVASELAGKGNKAESAKLFAELGDYKDSAERASRAYDETLESPAMLARQAYSDKNYSKAYESLENVDTSALPEKYADLKDIFEKCTYELANKAYADKNISRALELYRKIPEYNDVEDKLRLSSFKIIGIWISEDNDKELIFNEDGSCTVDGKEYKHFYVENYKLYIGDDISKLESEYTLSKWEDNAFNIRDIKASRHVYTRFIRAEEDRPAISQDKITMPIATEPTEDGPAPTAPVPIKLD